MALAKHRIVTRDGRAVIEERVDVHVEIQQFPDFKLSEETRKRLTSIRPSDAVTGQVEDEQSPWMRLGLWVFMCGVGLVVWWGVMS